MSSKVVIYGGSGQLGIAVTSLFKKHNWEVTSVGTRPNSDANYNIIVSIEDPLEVQGEKVLKQASEQLKNGEKYDAILCVAGGFSMGTVSSTDFLKSADLMIKKILHPSLIAAQLAVRHLKSEGILTLTGVALLKGTPDYVGYGATKAGVHQLVRSLSAKTSGLPKDVKVAALLPGMIDTPYNRQILPNADFSNFIPIDELTSRLYGWASGGIPVKRGTLLEVIARKGITTFTEIS